MSQYLRSIVYKSTFDGDEVEVVLRPLQFKDALKFRGLDSEAVASALMEILPGYVQEVRGLRAADGTAVTLAELLNSSYFTPLLVNVGLELVTRAAISNPLPPAP